MEDTPYILRLFDTDLSAIEGHIPSTINVVSGKVTIGRGANCDVLLSAERNKKFIISRAHASLTVVKKNNDYSITVEDLGKFSLFGSFYKSFTQSLYRLFEWSVC